MDSKFDILLKGGRLEDPQNGRSGICDIGIKGGKIEAVEQHLNTSDAENVFDVEGKYIIPGIIDLHMHASKFLGGPWGHRMLAQAGVTTALDMAGPIDEVLEYARDYGVGLTIGSVDRIYGGYNVSGNDPSRLELENALTAALKKGSLGLKILAGNYPLTPEAVALAIQVANENKAYIGFHAGSLRTGSNIEGFLEAVELCGNNSLHLAHINSYCRGAVRPCEQEVQEAIDALKKHPKIRSESYLASVNGNNAMCENGMPIVNVVRNCLCMGGYPPTEEGLKQAILEGWAQINMISGGETILCTGSEAVEYWLSRHTDTGVSFAVNPPGPRYRLAVEKRDSGEFVVDTISTDGGGIPRNVILSHGLSLVKFGALSMSEFVKKVSINPAKILGLHSKGHLEQGADADITVVDLEKQKAHLSIGSGKLIMYKGLVCGTGSNILTTSAGVDNVKHWGLTPIITDLETSAFYKGL